MANVKPAAEVLYSAARVFVSGDGGHLQPNNCVMIHTHALDTGLAGVRAQLPGLVACRRLLVVRMIWRTRAWRNRCGCKGAGSPALP